MMMIVIFVFVIHDVEMMEGMITDDADDADT